MTDVTAGDRPDRATVEFALRQSEVRYRHLADAMPQLVWTADASGQVDYYNNRISLYAGAHQLPDGAWRWEPLVHDDDISRTQDAWTHAVATGTMYTCEHRVRMADGSLRWHLSRALPRADAVTGTIRWFGTATDIHDQKRAEQALQSVVTELQHAMLGDVDRIDGLATGSVYLASEEGLDIGGDWYDVIDRGHGTAVLVIGDVVGHSLRAATTMGQLRSAARALATVCEGPLALLDRVERCARNLPGADCATLAIVYLDTATRSFQYVVAGHPPPLLLHPDGSAQLLMAQRHGPLGTTRAEHTTVHRGEVPPGGALVLYTDGLVERRGQPLDHGLERLAAVAGDHRGGPPELLARRLVDALRDPAGTGDDVAVLAVEPLGDRCMQRRIEARPENVAGVRHETRRLLESAGASPNELQDVLVLVGEAVANAAEHAYYGRDPGPIDVRVEHRSGHVHLTVCDQGSWRTPDAPGDRGRGAVLMRALADHLDLHTGPGGTVVHAVRRVGNVPRTS
jgi:PAS domain S-box-containing protein